MKWAKRLLAFLPAAVCAGLYAWCAASQTQIVIYYGAGAFRGLKLGLLIVTILAALIGLAVNLVPLAKALGARRQKRRELQEGLELSEEASRRIAATAVFARQNGRWDEDRIRNHLEGLLQSANTPAALLDFLLRYRAQMDRMNTWQGRLSSLIRNNAATDLHSAEDLLDRLEQNMLGRLRKAFNWIQVADLSETAISDELRENLTKIADENDELLEKARSLCETLSNYLNTQNEDRNGPVQLDHFILTLNEQIEEERETV